MRAYDLASPSCTSQRDATVIITVISNRACPVYGNLPTEVTISQSIAANARIFNASASDSDVDVSVIKLEKIKEFILVIF